MFGEFTHYHPIRNTNLLTKADSLYDLLMYLFMLSQQNLPSMLMMIRNLHSPVLQHRWEEVTTLNNNPFWW